MILVTGAAGYIGSHFAHQYLKCCPDARVIAVDNLSEGNRQAIEALSQAHPGRITFHQMNIGDPAMAALLQKHKVSAVVHFAASALVAESQADPLKYFTNNVGETMALLTHMHAAGVRNLVFSSTCATYGIPPSNVIDENTPQNPVNVYGRSKLMVEQMLATLHERGMLHYIALRYFNAAGADPDGMLGESHRHETHLIPIVLQVASGKRGELKIYGNDYPTPDGTCIRDYIHINDLADAHMRALEVLQSGQPVGEAFNLGTGQGDSVQTVVDLCREITGHDIPAAITPRRDGDPPVLVACANKAMRYFSWTPRYALREIIQTAWHWEQHRRF